MHGMKLVEGQGGGWEGGRPLEDDRFNTVYVLVRLPLTWFTCNTRDVLPADMLLARLRNGLSPPEARAHRTAMLHEPRDKGCHAVCSNDTCRACVSVSVAVGSVVQPSNQP